MAMRTPRSRWTPLNEKIAHLLFFALGVQTVGLLYARWALPHSGPHVVAVLLAFWCVIIGAIATTLAAETWPTAVCFALATAAAVEWPQWRYPIGSAANVMLMLNLGIIFVYQRRQLDARAREEARKRSVS